jgi:hypothetical protein
MIVKTCAVSGKKFEITDEDVKFYEKMGVPAPTLCPEERMRRRYVWRNERKLYQRSCDSCNKKMISTYHEDNTSPIYCTKCWWGDKWDALQHGKEFDFSRPFFDQFQELVKACPKPGIINDNETRSENSAYCQDTVSTKNCYLVVETGDARDSMYCHNVNGSVEVFDCYQAIDSELVYEGINCQGLYNCSFLQNSENCADCFLGYDLKSCKNCFGCVNLRNKEYFFLNQKYTKEEYLQKIKEIKSGSWLVQEELINSFKTFRLKLPHRYANFRNCENCLGHNVFNCQNVLGFDVLRSQNSKFVNTIDRVTYTYDAQGWKSSWCLETQTADESWMARFSSWCENCKNIDYSLHCYSCNDLLGCVGLRNKKFCILNKQYSEKDFLVLKEKIIEHMSSERRSASGGIIAPEWGEFFPILISPFAYNETVAQEYFPITKEEALAKGYRWRDDDLQNYKPQEYVIPDNISDVPTSVCEEILGCICCGKNYKIQKAELEFYRKMVLPIPRECPDCRHANRMKMRNPRRLWKRNCDKCDKAIQTTFAPDRPEKVYCEKCYLDSIE